MSKLNKKETPNFDNLQKQKYRQKQYGSLRITDLKQEMLEQ